MPGSMLFGSVAHPAGHPSWATMVSFLLQTFAVALSLLAPLLRTDALPRLRVAQSVPRAILLADTPPQRRPAAPSPGGISVVTSYAGPIRQPRTIPRGTLQADNAPPTINVGPGSGTPGLEAAVPFALTDGADHLLRLPIRIPPPPRARISQGVMQGYLVQRVQPDYPPLARQARVRDSRSGRNHQRAGPHREFAGNERTSHAGGRRHRGGAALAVSSLPAERRACGGQYEHHHRVFLGRRRSIAHARQAAGLGTLVLGHGAPIGRRPLAPGA